MRRSSITPRDLECMLCDETAEPRPLPLSLLEEITDGFSDEQRIGHGGFAVVYKGKLQNRTVAVKRMSNAFMDENVFHREVQCLMMAKHNNIVRFLGYCADRQGIMDKYEGKMIMADVHERLLCFEYLPKGSLHEYITDTSREPHWRDRFRIITGICHGLHYLHQNNIVHLDLKPANIVLDNNLVAKIADFGLSRCFAETQSRIITLNIGGTFGYLPPEFGNGEITYQFDIFSLGVIIMEILTGKKGYHDVDKVVASWCNILEKSQSDTHLKQVRVCAEIGIECIDSNPAKRPDTQHIINRLNEYIDTGVATSQQGEDAPNELHQDMPNTPGETSSEENSTAVTVAGTKPYDTFWRNIADLYMFDETMHSLNPDIKRCFEYCSIFPRGSKLRRDKLVCLWIAQGFVKTRSAEIASGSRIYIEEQTGKEMSLEDTPMDEEVIESICKRLPKLRVPAVAFSEEHGPIEQPNEFSFPESVSQLKYLRYLAFRTDIDCEITLPSTLNNLRHIQLLDFGGGDISEFTFAELVNLQHIFCSKYVKLPYIGRLSSLQTLTGFKVSNEQGCELKQLRDLNKLQGQLIIRGLENVKNKGQALEANLAAKRLTELTLMWRYADDTSCSPEVNADVLEGLCPHVELQILTLWNFVGLRYPDWMVGKHSGGPKYLQELHLWDCIQPGPASELAEAFPHLRVLKLVGCSWDALPGNMEYLTSLMDLWIRSCENIRSLPSLPQSLEKFRLCGCNAELTKSCQTVGHANWQKIEHIPDKFFR